MKMFIVLCKNNGIWEICFDDDKLPFISAIEETAKFLKERLERLFPEYEYRIAQVNFSE